MFKNNNKHKISELNDKINSLENKNNVLEGKLETSKEISELNDKIKALENRNDTLESQLENIKKENSDLKNDIETFKNGNKVLENKLEAINKDNSELNEKISHVKNDINIQSGVYKTCFPGKEAYMRRGNGQRSFVGHINFNKPYKNIPQVMTSLSGLDAGDMHNIRITISASNITTTGFDINIQTWADTSLYLVHISWISFQ